MLRNNCIMAAEVWNKQLTPPECNCTIGKVAVKWQSSLAVSFHLTKLQESVPLPWEKYCDNLLLNVYSVWPEEKRRKVVD